MPRRGSSLDGHKQHSLAFTGRAAQLRGHGPRAGHHQADLAAKTPDLGATKPSHSAQGLRATRCRLHVVTAGITQTVCLCRSLSLLT